MFSAAHRTNKPYIWYTESTKIKNKKESTNRDILHAYNRFKVLNPHLKYTSAFGPTSVMKRFQTLRRKCKGRWLYAANRQGYPQHLISNCTRKVNTTWTALWKQSNFVEAITMCKGEKSPNKGNWLLSFHCPQHSIDVTFSLSNSCYIKVKIINLLCCCV